MIILTIQNLHKAFGGNVVLKDVSMVLQDRQRMGLVGVNGCGKSTLLKILAGKEQADGGAEVFYENLDKAAGWKCVGQAGGLRWTGTRRPEVDLCPAQMKIRFEREETT